jgi:drug/metabolite transporter (DMT)-like permease
MSRRVSEHTTAVLKAVLVVFLWATSWVFIKIGLNDHAIPALTFAGLRYVMASGVLTLFAMRPSRLRVMRQLPREKWIRLAVLGVFYYGLAQGAQFLALNALDAITTNLLLGFSTVVITLLAIVFLREHPHPLQWAGMVLYLIGVLIYFGPGLVSSGHAGNSIPFAGMMIALLCVLANSIASIIGRQVNRAGDVDPVTVTLISMGIGSLLLLASGIITQGLPGLDVQAWLIIGWLAVVNTAVAFTLWNATLRVLSAMESSIINSLMMVFIPVLAWLFLGEGLTLQQGAGMILAGLGILIVQLRRRHAIAAQPAARIEPLPEEIG